VSWARKAAGPIETTVPPKDRPVRAWSAQQQAIFDWYAEGEGHLVVRARAGTGKTSTIVEAAHRVPAKTWGLCTAYNKRIVQELTARLASTNTHEAKSIHSVGFTLVRAEWAKVQLPPKHKPYLRGRGLTDVVLASSMGPSEASRTPWAAKAMVTKLHTLGREIDPKATPKALLTLGGHFECDPGDGPTAQGFDLAWVTQRAHEAMALAAQGPTEGYIDFADMIYLPVVHAWTKPVYTLITVDEAQDMSATQLTLVRQVLAPGGRMVIVGDDRQAIYGWRGADSNALDRLKGELGATELGLTTVAKAQKEVPDIIAADTNGPGTIDTTNLQGLLAKAGPGDFILSRVNAPLASLALAFLRKGIKTEIAGRDIGDGLIRVVEAVAKGTMRLDQTLTNLRVWEDLEVQKAMAHGWDSRAAQVHDQAETIRALADGLSDPQALVRRIAGLFVDEEGQGAEGRLVLSSVHKAKGLERRRVFILGETLRRDTLEERNIGYVALTRAQDEVWYVW
jgi:superfamily I DNA/RNA helicase